jgi:hypothetical protein
MTRPSLHFLRSVKTCREDTSAPCDIGGGTAHAEHWRHLPHAYINSAALSGCPCGRTDRRRTRVEKLSDGTRAERETGTPTRAATVRGCSKPRDRHAPFSSSSSSSSSSSPAALDHDTVHGGPPTRMICAKRTAITRTRKGGMNLMPVIAPPPSFDVPGIVWTAAPSAGGSGAARASMKPTNPRPGPRSLGGGQQPETGTRVAGNPVAPHAPLPRPAGSGQNPEIVTPPSSPPPPPPSTTTPGVAPQTGTDRHKRS